TGSIFLNGLNGNGSGINFTGYGTGVIISSASGKLISSTIDLSSGSYVANILGITNGGTGTSSTPSQGTLLIGNASNGYSVANLTAGFGITITNGNGSITIGSNQGTNWFTQNAGLLYPINSTLDFALGGSSTSSSKFAVINVNSGTPTASISANNGNNATYLTGNGTLGTTNAQNLTIGGSTTGNITISPLNGNGTLTLNGNFVQTGSSTFTTGTGLTTVSGNLLASGTASVSGALTLFGTPTIQSTSFQNLTLGSSTTGSIFLNGLNGNGSGINFTGYGTGVLLSSQTGNITSGTVNLASSSYVSGILGSVNGGSPFDIGSGSIFERNNTLDLLLGGSSTSSSKFAFINVNSGTPTASISANSGNNATYLTGNGTLGTTNTQNLTIGSPSTGNVTINALNGGTGSVITLNGLTEQNSATTVNYNTGNTVIGTTATNSTLQLNANGTGTLTLNNGGTGNIQFFGTSNYITSTGTLQLQGNIYQPVSGGISGYFQLANNVISPSNTINDLAIGGNSTSSALFQIFGSSGNASTSGSITFNNVAGNIQTTNSKNLTIGGATTGNITLNPLNGIAGGNISPAVNNVTDLGTTTLAYRNIYAATDIKVGGTSVCLQNSASCGFALGTNYWQLNNNALSPYNNTLDVLIGSTSTSSAKFAFLNVAGNTPTASISAGNGTNNSTYLTGTGVLSTTNAQNLTIGGSTTGNIALTPLNGNGSVTVNGNIILPNNNTVTGITGYTNVSGALGVGSTTGSPTYYINTTTSSL
ncbi:MAG: S-layer family protein, partial [Thaumarchaeota archaeon]|nr:S-layer family protein [Nitrososphaerota archaeon]